MALKQKQKIFKRKGVKKMKKFTKIFLSCAMVSAVAAASASLAMAADLEDEYAIAGAGSEALNGVYTTSSNDVELDGIEPDPDTQVTFLVYKAGTDETVVTADNVIGIDQFNSGDEGETSVQPENSGLKAGSVTAPDEGQNKYIVKVGYYEDGTFKTSTAFFLTGESSVTTTDITIGDVDFANGIIATDATMIARYATGSTAAKGHVGDVYTVADEDYADVETITIGDVDFANGIIATDATMIARYATGSTAAKGHVGETITVEAKDAE